MHSDTTGLSSGEMGAATEDKSGIAWLYEPPDVFGMERDHGNDSERRGYEGVAVFSTIQQGVTWE